MKLWWSSLLAFSLLALVVVAMRSSASRAWIKRMSLQLVAAALLLYFLNESGLIQGLTVPLNPVTIAAVIVLGVPGIFLILGLESVLL